MHASMIRKPYPLAEACAQQADPKVVVAVAGRVPVAIRGPSVRGVVVPRAPAQPPDMPAPPSRPHVPERREL